MTATQLIVIASLATVALSGLAIYVGLKSVRDQMRVTVFLEYTERYAKIMDNMPYKAREPGSGYRLASQSDEERHRVLEVFREYLNLCSEEKWLHDQKRIDNPTWEIWKCGMRDVTRFPPFREAWSHLEPEYEAYQDFQEFVNQTLLSDLESSQSNALRRQLSSSVDSAQNQQATDG
jgi:hypothetical protein